MANNDYNNIPERLGCTIDVPYPQVSGICADPCLAAELSEAYAGRNGELTGISQYLYQSLLLEGINCRAAEMLECVAEVEMRHFKLLGQLIYALGGDPVLRVNCRRADGGWWSGSYPEYGGDLCSMMCANIDAERDAVNSYCRLLRMTGDNAVRTVLERILLDERHHLELFTTIRSHCC